MVVSEMGIILVEDSIEHRVNMAGRRVVTAG
jgi:hypothetical protein